MKKRDIIVLAALIIALGAWWFFSKKNVIQPNIIEGHTPPTVNNNQNIEDTNPGPIDFTGVQVDTSNWLKYTNQEEGYSLKYPSDWKMEDLTSSVDPEFNYSSSVSIHADSNIPLYKNFKSVNINCCVTAKTLNSLQNTTIDKVSSQELNINGNKVLILNTGPSNNAGEVLIYVTANNKIFDFNIMQPDVYNRDAYKIAVGVIRNFKVIK